MSEYEAEERAWRDRRAEKEIRAGVEVAEPQTAIKPLPCPYPDCNPDDCVRIEFANDSVTIVCGWCDARGPACLDAESATNKWNTVALATREALK